MDIHIFWEGPFNISEIKSKNNADSDYGIYQVYGNHPMYGNSVLLYIGQANDQTFSKRISQEGWLYESDPKNTQFYIGKLGGHKLTSEAGWGEKIDRAEKLLIYSHLPCYNTANTKSIPEEYVSNNVVYNWNSFRNLFPEVSGKRYTSNFDHLWEENVYTYKNLKAK